jgi:predicted ATP-dependent serine protease
MTAECKCCGKKKELRIGVCWDCAEAESIIDDGTDMRDNGTVIDGERRPAKTAMEKLKLLIERGWAH